MRIRFFPLLFLFLFSFSSTAFSQNVSSPSSSPWVSEARGFIKAHLGISYLPYVGVSFEQEDYVVLSSPAAGIPGLCAGLSAIPLFKDNHGLNINVAYSLNSVKFETKIEGKKGFTNFGISNIDFNVGYTKFFLDGPWYLYTSIYGGFDLVIIQVRTHLQNQEDDDVKTDSKDYSFGLGGNFGFMRSISSGGIGMELRIDSSVLQDSFKVDHQFGKTKMNVWHPLQLKLALSFFLGRI